MAIPATEIVEKAERLAARLNGDLAPVKKNVLLALVSDFMSEPEPDVHRLRQLLDLIEQGSGGHIRRGAGYGDQLRAAISELRTVLNEEELEGQDYKSLFGWTARLLLVRRESARPEPQDHRSDPRERPQSQTPRRPGPRQREERRPAPSPGSGKLSAVGTKSLSTLEKLKRDLEDKEKNGKR